MRGQILTTSILLRFATSSKPATTGNRRKLSTMPQIRTTTRISCFTAKSGPIYHHSTENQPPDWMPTHGNPKLTNDQATHFFAQPTGRLHFPAALQSILLFPNNRQNALNTSSNPGMAGHGFDGHRSQLETANQKHCIPIRKRGSGKPLEIPGNDKFSPPPKHALSAQPATYDMIAHTSIISVPSCSVHWIQNCLCS